MRQEDSMCVDLTVARGPIKNDDGEMVLMPVPCYPTVCMYAVQTPDGFYCSKALTSKYPSNKIDMEVPNA